MTDHLANTMYDIWRTHFVSPSTYPTDFISALRHEVKTSFARKCEAMIREGRFKALADQNVMLTFEPVTQLDAELIKVAFGLMLESKIHFSLIAKNIVYDGNVIKCYFTIR